MLTTGESKGLIIFNSNDGSGNLVGVLSIFGYHWQS